MLDTVRLWEMGTIIMTNILQTRGIAETANSAGWQANGNGWTYPVFDLSGNAIGTRWKASDSNATPKYRWQPSKPKDDMSDWYILPNTQADDGVLYLANGEPSLLAMHAGRVCNSISTTHSEVTVPSNTIEVLRALNVTRLIYIVDNDDAGATSAIKWRNALRGSGIDYEARQWQAWGNKADANDVWMAVGFDTSAFKDAIDSAQVLDLPAPTEPLYTPSFDDTDFDKTPQGLIDALVSALHVPRFKSNGWSVNVSSPFHEDKKPSFGIRQDTGVGKDFALGDSYSPTEIADALNINWRAYYPQRTPQSKTTQNYKQAKQQLADSKHKVIDLCLYEYDAFPGGYITGSWIDSDSLPLAWVQAVLGLAHGRSAVAPVMVKLHHAIRTGRINPYEFTLADVHKYVIGKRRKSTDAALETLVQWGFVSFWSVSSNSNYSQQNDTKGGRPSQGYRIATRDPVMVSAVLNEMMARKITEDASKNKLAPRTNYMGFDMGLEPDELKAWKERTKDDVDWSAKYAIERLTQEWSDRLYNHREKVTFDIGEITSAKDMRVSMLRDLLRDYPKGVQISNIELGMYLGCSKDSVSNLYDDAHVKSQRKREWKTIELGDKPINLDKELKAAMREHQGMALAIKLKCYDESEKRSYYTNLAYGESAMYAALKRNKRVATKLYIMVEQPSLVYLASAVKGFWIAYLYQFYLVQYVQDCLTHIHETMPEEIKALEQDTIETETEIVPTPKVVKQRTPRQSSTPDRDYSEHDYKFLREQLSLEAHVFTEDGMLPDSLTNVQAVRWLNKHAQPKRLRSPESYYEKDDGISTLIDLLQYLGGQELSPLEVKRRQANQAHSIEINESDPLPFDGGRTPEPIPVVSDEERERIINFEPAWARKETPHKSRFASILEQA